MALALRANVKFVQFVYPDELCLRYRSAMTMSLLCKGLF